LYLRDPLRSREETAEGTGQEERGGEKNGETGEGRREEGRRQTLPPLVRIL